MARRSTKSRGERAALTRAKNKKAALALAAQTAENERQLAEEQERERQYQLEQLTARRIEQAYRDGLDEGRRQGLNSGRQEGYRQAQIDLDSAAKNLAERQTELGSCATVIDSMAKVVEAGSQALTGYFGDKRNGPNAPALAAIDETLNRVVPSALNGARRPAGPVEIPVSISDIMSMLTGGPSPLG